MKQQHVWVGRRLNGSYQIGLRKNLWRADGFLGQPMMHFGATAFRRVFGPEVQLELGEVRRFHVALVEAPTARKVRR